MEFLAVVGGVSAVTSIAGDMASCIRIIRHFCRDIRYGEEDLRLVKLEVQACKLFASMFKKTMGPVESKVMRMARESGLDKGIQEQSRTAREQIRRVLKDLKPLENSKSASLIPRILAAWTWHNHKKDVKASLSILVSVKISLHLLATLVSNETITAQLSQASSLDVETRDLLLKELKSQKREIRSLRIEIEECRRDLQTQSNLVKEGFCTSGLLNFDTISSAFRPIETQIIRNSQVIIQEAEESPTVTHSPSRSLFSTSDQQATPISSNSSFSHLGAKALSVRENRNGLFELAGNDQQIRASPQDETTAPSSELALVLFRHGAMDREGSSARSSVLPPIDETLSDRAESMTGVPVYHDYADGHKAEFTREISITAEDCESKTDQSSASSPSNPTESPGVYVPTALFGPPIPQRRKRKRTDNSSDSSHQ